MLSEEQSVVWMISIVGQLQSFRCANSQLSKCNQHLEGEVRKRETLERRVWLEMQLSKLSEVADQGYCKRVYILKVFAQIGRVFDGLFDFVTDSFEAGVACLCTIFDE